MRRSRSFGAAATRCPGCGTRLLTQWVGRVAALNARCDAAPITTEQETALRTRDRLTWCLVTGRWRNAELRWRCRTACGHERVIEHRCPPETQAYGRRPEGAMW